MIESDFQLLMRLLYDDHVRNLMFVKQLPPLTEEQRREITDLLARQRQELGESLSKRLGSGAAPGDRLKAARSAAQQVVAEDDGVRLVNGHRGWTFWIAIAIAAIIAFIIVKLRVP